MPSESKSDRCRCLLNWSRERLHKVFPLSQRCPTFPFFLKFSHLPFFTKISHLSLYIDRLLSNFHAGGETVTMLHEDSLDRNIRFSSKHENFLIENHITNGGSLSSSQSQASQSPTALLASSHSPLAWTLSCSWLKSEQNSSWHKNKDEKEKEMISSPCHHRAFSSQRHQRPPTFRSSSAQALRRRPSILQHQPWNKPSRCPQNHQASCHRDVSDYCHQE